MKPLPVWILVGVVFGAGVVCAAGAGKVVPEPKPADTYGIGTITAAGHFQHTGAYPALALAWQVEDRVPQAVGVFPHPVLPDRVLVATRGGVLLSDDAGRRWQPLAEAAAGRVGLVRSVAFSPDVPDTFFLGTDHQGIWATRDGGKTFRQVGSKAAGLASDDVAAVVFHPHDRRFRTLLAAHGEAAPGLSFSRDGGAAWHVAAPDFYVHQVQCGGPGDAGLFLVASRKKQPDLRSIYYCESFDDFWFELVHDLIPTDAALSILARREGWTESVFRGASVFFATSDAGLYRVTQGGGQRVGPQDAALFLSTGCAWGPHADSQVLYAYEPRRLGLLVSTDGWQTFRPLGTGLFTGPYVKEGARVRANANGTVFYAAINEGLYVGRREVGAVGVADVHVAPAIFTFEAEGYRAAMVNLREDLRTFANERFAAHEAKKIVRNARDARAFLSDTEFSLTARVTARDAHAKSVTVDLSRVGGLALAPMFDDGAHQDGAAGDGVYGVQFRLDPRRLKSDTRDCRRPYPGLMGLTVTVVGADGSLAGAVGVLAVYDRPESFTLGGRKTEPIGVTGEPWTRAWTTGDPRDITGYHAVTFWIKTDLAQGEDVTVQLRDSQPFSLPTTTPPLGLLKDAFLDGGAITPQWRLVTIPLARFLKGAPQFEISRLGALVLSGEGKVPGTYWVDEIRFHLSADDLNAYVGAMTQ